MFKVKHDSVPEVKSKVKTEENISSHEMIKTEIKKEEDDLISSKCYVCPTCSMQCGNEESFVTHVQQNHVTSSTPDRKRRRLTSSSVARNFISEVDMEGTISKISSKLKIGEKVTVNLIVDELGLLIEGGKFKKVRGKLNNYIQRRRVKKGKGINHSKSVAVLNVDDGILNMKAVTSRIDNPDVFDIAESNTVQTEPKLSSSTSIPTTSLDSVALTLIGERREGWGELTPSGKTRRKRRISKNIAAVLHIISVLSEGSLSPSEILKDVEKEIAPDGELASKREKLKPEA